MSLLSRVTGETLELHGAAMRRWVAGRPLIALLGVSEGHGVGPLTEEGMCASLRFEVVLGVEGLMRTSRISRVR